MPQIQIKDMVKIFPVDATNISAVDKVSLDIEKGEFMSIVGHSGSGKTTLISILGGILRPTSGKVMVDGQDICSLDDNALSEYRSTRIGFMFQFASLLPILTSMENVLLPMLFSPRMQEGAEDKAVEYLKMVGLADKIGSYPSQLSGGQQRRVAIARALINDPDIILADEPTGDLDEDTEADIMRLLKDINLKRQVTLVLVTHNMDLAAAATTRLRMSHGVLSTRKR